MINKKALIIIGLSTILLSSLTVGVFSKYSTTIDSGNGEITAKRFIVKTDINDGISENDIKLSPGEYKVRNFSIQNYDNGNTSEISTTIKLSVDWTSTIIPLKCELYENISGSLVQLLSFEDGSTYNNETLAYQYNYKANEAVANNFQLKISWTDSSLYNPEDYINSTASYRININALQENNAIPSEKEVLLEAFSKVLDNEYNKDTNEGKIKEYFDVNKKSEFNGNKLTIVDSSGTNWGQKYLSPALEDVLGLERGTFASKATYKVVRYPKANSEGISTYSIQKANSNYGSITKTKAIQNTKWYFDVYLINKNINGMKSGSTINNVYHLDCSDLKIYRGSCLSWSGNADAGANSKLNVEDDLTNLGFFVNDESFTPIDFSYLVA